MSVLSNSEKRMNNKNKCCLRENYALVAWLLLPLSNTATISQCSYVNKQKKKLHLTLLFAIYRIIHNGLILKLTNLETIFLTFLGISSFFKKAAKIRPLPEARKLCLLVFIWYLPIQSYYFINIINRILTIIVIEKTK